MLAILCTGLISYCSVPLELLGPLLSEIVVALSFWVTRFPDIIANIFTYLIVTNQLVHNHFTNQFPILGVLVSHLH